MTEWIYCRNIFPPKNTWVYVCLLDSTKSIAKRTLFFNKWKFTNGSKQYIHNFDKWMHVSKAPLEWRKDAVKYYGYAGIPIDD